MHNQTDSAATHSPRIVALASDHAGFALKESLKPLVESLGFLIHDLGTHDTQSVDYPFYGTRIGEAVAQGHATFGVAVCGSGIGISIAANRIKGARCALCSTALAAQLSREHNDANIIALGARLIGQAEAEACVTQFLTTAFSGGRHSARVSQLG